jgi:hypothetical protein
MLKFIVLMAGLTFCLPLIAIDVSFYGLIKSHHYFQAPGSAPTALSSNGFAFNAFVIGSGPETILGATVRLPNNGPTKTLEPEVEGSIYRFEEQFNTSQALESAYPNGNLLSGYRFTIQTANDGPQTGTLMLLGLSYPAIPEIANLAQAQAVDAGSEFTLHWKPLNGTSLDIVQLVIYGSNFVYSTPAPFEEGALDGTATSVVFPAGTFPHGALLQARLGIVRPGLPNVNYGTGIPGLARETSFEMMTLAVAEPPRLELLRAGTGEGVLLRLTGQPGQTYELFASSDLNAWSTVLVTNSSSGVIEWSDPKWSELPARFYRAQLSP